MRHKSTYLLLAICLAVAASAGAKVKKKATKKPAIDVEATLRQAEDAFMAYDFDQATELLDKLNEAKPDEMATDSIYENLRRRVDMGSTMLSRVERISIIDSIVVDKNDFFNAYKLSAPTGYIVGEEALPPGMKLLPSTTVYTTESNDAMLWSEPDSKNGGRLVESHLLADGTWERPSSLGDALNSMPDAAYPFLMPDGSTLYFAAKGDESLGGYDLFVSRNNGDEFLQPQNMGMPYNSPYDDYMLAIDELTGAGWWATDRNRLDGQLTIYVFVPQELRVSYPIDTPELPSLAMIKDISKTGDGADHSAVAKAIKDLEIYTQAKEPEFRFELPGGKVYTSMSDFHSQRAVDAMNDYLDALYRLYDLEEQLESLRIDYETNRSVGPKIIQLENNIQQLRPMLTKLSNEVVKAETAK